MQMLQRFTDKYLEDPNNPLLGPTLKSLTFVGIWRVGTKTQNTISTFILIAAVLIHLSQWIKFIQLLIAHDDIPTLTESLYTMSTANISYLKAVSLICFKENWKELFDGIAYEEILEQGRANSSCQDVIKKYTLYSRRIYWLYALLSVLLVIFVAFAPLVVISFSMDYRESIINGTEPYPQFLIGWYPFDNSKPPGYIPAIIVQFYAMNFFCICVMSLDLNSANIMIFFKVHLMILGDKCSKLFDDDEGELTREVVTARVKECHRHHLHLMELKDTYNSLLDPVMFWYVVVCAIVICSTVFQITTPELPPSKKLFPVLFAVILILQLLCYCWHSTLVYDESNNVDRRVYDSAWWRADVRMRKDLILLGGQLTQTFVINAGPFVVLSVETFIAILKFTYSIYTLLTQTLDN